MNPYNKIKQVCVIGAGVMGSGIAAHIANSGTKVLLFDISTSGANPSAISKSAIEKMLVTKPNPLSHPSKAQLITACNLVGDLEKIKDCDLIIEAIVENLEVKQTLYQKLLPYLKEEAIISSNTSTLNLGALKERLPQDIRKRFIILHFFNPARYMPLLELVRDKETDDSIVTKASIFVSHCLGKEVVECKDTPGFIANRIGCFLLELSLRKTLEHKVDIEIIDYIMSKYLYLPTTSIFGLYDLIGLDVMRLISTSLCESLRENDKFTAFSKQVPEIEEMINRNYIGRKSGSGFYRIVKSEDGSKAKEAIDLKTLEYRKCKDETYEASDINQILSTNSPTCKAIREIILEFGSYVTSLVPEITNDIYDIDKAMRLGYNWKYGPFELFNHIIKDGFRLIAQWQNPLSVFIEKKEYLNIKQESFFSKTNSLEQYTKRIIFQNDSCKLSLLSNSDLCFSIATKMNCLNHEIFNSLVEAISYTEKENKKLYIYSDSSHFSAGADINIFLKYIDTQNWNKIDEFLILGQQTMQRMKYSSAAIISCASGAALGGGSELLLHSTYIHASDQLLAGLAEAKLGLIPAFGGTKEMLIRGCRSTSQILRNLRNIILANKTTSADYFAHDYGLDVHVNMNRKYLLEEAMQTQHAAPKYFYKENHDYLIPKFNLEKELESNILDDHTHNIIQLLQTISGSKITEENMLILEREIFLQLIASPKAKNQLEKMRK